MDVAVVGGGPVGSALCLYLRRAGISVTLIDAGASERKVCGEGLLPAGWEVIEDLGLAPQLTQRAPIEGLVYGMPSESGGWRSMAAPLTRPAYGVQRGHLFGQFRSALEEHGVSVLDSTRVTGLHIQADGVELSFRSRSPLRASLVVGADGLHSTVRRKAGLQPEKERQYSRWGARCYFRSKEVRRSVEVTLGDGLESYLTPLGDDLYGLAFLWSPHLLGRPLPGEGPVYQRLLGLLPEQMLERLPKPDGEFWGGETAIGPLQQQVETPLHPSGRVALVGDAAGYFDALTGEGLCLGLRQAQTLAKLIVGQRLDAYPAAHRAIKRRHNLVVGGLLWLIHQPRLRKRVFSSLAAAPEQFKAVIRFAVEEASWASLLSPQLFRFLLGLLHPKRFLA